MVKVREEKTLAVCMVILVITSLSSMVAADSLGEEEGEDEEEEEKRAKEYLIGLNEESRLIAKQMSLAEWDYNSNISDETLENKLRITAETAKKTKELWKETVKFNWQKFKDPDTKRQFKLFSHLGNAALSEEKLVEFNRLLGEMTASYSTATICDFKNRTQCNIMLEPEIVEIMAKSRDPKELFYVWVEWRKVSGAKFRKMWERYVVLSNEAAKANNKSNNAEVWISQYESEDFHSQIDKLWEQLKPLYKQLHAYVRRRLREEYSGDVVSKSGPLPVHLLGEIWGSSWMDIYSITEPYPNSSSIDLTNKMIEQGYTVEKIFRLAEDFFLSLGFDKMPDTFWKNSILEKPTDGREIVCHASASNFFDSDDFRIQMCTMITFNHLQTVHHEMGHVQCFLQQKDLPFIYREDPNPGFGEAIGDMITLSVTTPKHLRKIGLLTTDLSTDERETINFLYRQALEKVAFLPYAILIDTFRWNVFNGNISHSNYNCAYWKLRNEVQGVEPPVDRSEEDFDPGAKYHVITDAPYIGYFVSYIIQFQFYRALCIKAKQFDPKNPAAGHLHECDIYNSKEAGGDFIEMLKMGLSKPWPDAMEKLTDQREMDASGMLEYFKPLQDWLEKDNMENNEYVGWVPSTKKCRGRVLEVRAMNTFENTDQKSSAFRPKSHCLHQCLLVAFFFGTHYVIYNFS